MLGVRLRVPNGAEAVTVLVGVGKVITVTALAALGSDKEGKGAIGAGREKFGIYEGNGENQGVKGE